MKIERRWDFIALNKDKQIDLNKIDAQTQQKLEENGISLDDLRKADINGDGVITNAAEVEKLFGLINAHDDDGKDWTIRATRADGSATRAGQLHSVLSLQFADPTTSHLPPERVTNRSDFLDAFYGHEINVSDMESQSVRDRLWGAGEASLWGMKQADLDGDGTIVGRDEFSALFDYIQKFDGDGGDNSLVQKNADGSLTNAGKLLSLVQELAGTGPGMVDPVVTQPTNGSTTDRLTTYLTSAAADGLTGAELQRAETMLMDAGLSYDQAVSAITSNFGAHLFGDIDVSAAEYIQSGWGSMEGHVKVLEGLLEERMGVDGTLIDANFDGKLDGNDLFAVKNADGSMDVREIGTNVAQRVRIGAAMKNACLEMDSVKHDFALLKDHRANPDFFELVPHGRRNWGDQAVTFKLKPGVKASDAMNDIFNNPDAYGFECATAMIIVYYRAIQEAIGDEDFNRIMGDLRIGPWDYEGDLAAFQNRYPDSASEKLFTGDYTYIKNWDVSDEGKKAGWQGENVIYLGGDQYYGHPFGVASADKIVNYLNGHRNAGSTTSASRMEDLRTDLDPTLFQHDLNPN